MIGKQVGVHMIVIIMCHIEAAILDFPIQTDVLAGSDRFGRHKLSTELFSVRS